MCEESTGETLFQISMFITYCQKYCYYYAHMHIQYYIGYIHMWAWTAADATVAHAQPVTGEEKV